MAVVVCVACGLLFALACWVACGGEGGGASVAARRAIVLRAARNLLTRMGASPFVRTLLRVRPAASCADELTRRMHNTEHEVERGEAMALVVCAAAMASGLGALCSRSIVGAAVVLCALLLGLHLRTTAREHRRREELAQEMPAVFRTLANSMGSGHTLVQSLDYVGLHEHGAAAEAFARASLRVRCGMSAENALEELATELDAPGVRLMVTALAISQRTGSPLRELFQRSAQLVEQAGDLERTLSVKTAQVRLSVRIVCGLPPLMVLLLALISVDYQQGLLCPSGMACLALAVAMDGLALVAIRRILGGVLS